jgi:hypothetical protein
VRVLWSVPLDLRSRELHPLARAAAVPQESVTAPSQLVWLDAVAAHPDFAELRADAWESVWAVAVVLALCADWSMMLSRPTHDVVAERAGVCRRTVARVRARLEAAGLVGIVTPGRTSDPVDPDAGPLAQAYVLTIPRALYGQLAPEAAAPDLDDVPAAGGRQDGSSHGWEDEGQSPARPVKLQPEPDPTRDDGPAGTSVDETVTPSCPTSGGTGEEDPRTRAGARTSARSARGDQTEDRPDGTGRDLGRGACWPTTVRPTTRTERHLAAAEAWRIDPVLRRVSVAHVAALCREWHLAGWTVADIRHALVHRPDGTPWPHSLVAADVRHVPGWFRHRLAAWRTDPADPASPPRLSRSQHAEAAHAAEQTAHAQLAAADDAAVASAVAADDVDDWTTGRADLATRTAAAAAARRLQAATRTAQEADRAAGPAPAAPSTSARSPRAVRPTSAAAEAPGSRRPVDQAPDPRIGALRAAARARPRPRR